MNRERLVDTLNLDEGCNLKRHEVDGIDHIGWGINLEEELPDQLLEYLGVEDEDDIHEITQEQADYLRDYFIHIATDDCVTIYGPEVWTLLSPLRQEVLVNLSYNLGLPRLKAFRKMNAAIRSGNYEEAVNQMLDSKAAREQAPKRYKRLANVFGYNDETYLGLPTLYDDDIPNLDAPGPGGSLSDFSDADLLAEVAKRLGIQG